MNDHELNNADEVNQNEPSRRSKLPKWLQKRRNRWITSSTLVVGIIGSSIGIATSNSNASVSTSTTASSTPAHAFGAESGKAISRTAPAPGGTTGKIETVSASSFTLTTPAGQKVTVNESSSTTYQNGTRSASTSVVKRGKKVLVLGTVDSTTIAAKDVSVEAATSGVPSSASTVIPFDQGAPSAKKQVGTIPAVWSAGQGTLVAGSAANRATEAALAAYPGGIVDRVVVLGDGDYNVHFIGVNWPHHVFLNSRFKVIGAE